MAPTMKSGELPMAALLLMALMSVSSVMGQLAVPITSRPATPKQNVLKLNPAATSRPPTANTDKSGTTRLTVPFADTMVIIDLPSNALRIPPSASSKYKNMNQALQDILSKQFSGLNGAAIPPPPRPLIQFGANNGRWSPMSNTRSPAPGPRPQQLNIRTQNAQSFPVMSRPINHRPRSGPAGNGPQAGGAQNRRKRINSINDQLPKPPRSPTANNKPRRFSSPMLPFRTVASMPRGQFQRPNGRPGPGNQPNFMIPEQLFNQIINELVPQMTGTAAFSANPQGPPAFLPREPMFEQLLGGNELTQQQMQDEGLAYQTQELFDEPQQQQQEEPTKGSNLVPRPPTYDNFLSNLNLKKSKPIGQSDISQEPIEQQKVQEDVSDYGPPPSAPRQTPWIPMQKTEYPSKGKPAPAPQPIVQQKQEPVKGYRPAPAPQPIVQQQQQEPEPPRKGYTPAPAPQPIVQQKQEQPTKGYQPPAPQPVVQQKQEPVKGYRPAPAPAPQPIVQQQQQEEPPVKGYSPAPQPVQQQMSTNYGQEPQPVKGPRSPTLMPPAPIKGRPAPRPVVQMSYQPPAKGYNEPPVQQMIFVMGYEPQSKTGPAPAPVVQQQMVSYDIPPPPPPAPVVQQQTKGYSPPPTTPAPIIQQQQQTYDEPQQQQEEQKEEYPTKGPRPTPAPAVKAPPRPYNPPPAAVKSRPTPAPQPIVQQQQQQEPEPEVKGRPQQMPTNYGIKGPAPQTSTYAPSPAPIKGRPRPAPAPQPVKGLPPAQQYERPAAVKSRPRPAPAVKGYQAPTTTTTEAQQYEEQYEDTPAPPPAPIKGRPRPQAPAPVKGYTPTEAPVQQIQQEITQAPETKSYRAPARRPAPQPVKGYNQQQQEEEPPLTSAPVKSAPRPSPKPYLRPPPPTTKSVQQYEPKGRQQFATTTSTTIVYDNKATYTQPPVTMPPSPGKSARIFADDEFTEHDMPREMNFDEMPTADEEPIDDPAAPNAPLVDNEPVDEEFEIVPRRINRTSSRVSARLVSDNDVPARTVPPFRSLPLSPANRARVLSENGDVSTRSPNESGFDDESADTGFDDGFGDSSNSARSNNLVDTTTVAPLDEPATRPSIFLRRRPERPQFNPNNQPEPEEAEPIEPIEPEAEIDDAEGDDENTEIPPLFNFGDRLRNLRTVRKVSDADLASEQKLKKKPCDEEGDYEEGHDNPDDYGRGASADLIDYDTDYVNARDYFDEPVQDTGSDEYNRNLTASLKENAGNLKSNNLKEDTTTTSYDDSTTTTAGANDRLENQESSNKPSETVTVRTPRTYRSSGTESRIKRFVVRPWRRVRLSKDDLMSMIGREGQPASTTTPSSSSVTSTSSTIITTTKSS